MKHQIYNSSGKLLQHGQRTDKQSNNSRHTTLWPVVLTTVSQQQFSEWSQQRLRKTVLAMLTVPQNSILSVHPDRCRWRLKGVVSVSITNFSLQTNPPSTGRSAWCSGNESDPISEVTVRRARLILRWVTACGQVNHLGM